MPDFLSLTSIAKLMRSPDVGYMRTGYGFRSDDYGDFNRGDYVRGYETESDYEDRRSYRALGPKNYQRSDERIQEDVCERLAMDERVDASDVEVNVRDRGQKRRAEDVADSVGGVKDVENRVHVGR